MNSRWPKKKRLHYVAATRAGSQLVITDRKKDKNPWKFFEESLENEPELEVPELFPQDLPRETTLEFGDVKGFERTLEARWESIEPPTYQRTTVRDIALVGRPETRPVRDPASIGEHGTEWGGLIHTLLQTAMRDPNADLRKLAAGKVEDLDLSRDWIEEAVETVRCVIASDLWKRASRSKRTLVEVPFQVLAEDTADSDEVSSILSGIIDLVFREEHGWVLVDYKTDSPAGSDFGPLVDHYRPQVALYAREWERITKETVAEKALYFIHADRYVALG